MSTEALAVCVSISGVFVLVIVGIVIINKRSPRTRVTGQKNNTRTTRVKKGTENIKRKAEKLKSEKIQSPCCGHISCCRGRRTDGPLPGPPFGVEAQGPSETEITILWNGPAVESSATPVLGYRIYKRFKTKPDDWIEAGKVTFEKLEFRIKNLVPNKRYVFGVSSKGKQGDSAIVETQSTLLKKNPVQPGGPTEFHVIAKSSSSLTLSWKPPRKGGYSRIHTYYLMMKDCERNATWTYLITLPAFDRFMDYKVTGLKSRHPYRFRVNAENVAGLGPYAETVTFETPDIDPEPPGKPKGPIKYARISHNSITLSWRPPEHDGGKPISGYAIDYKDKEGKMWHKAGVSEAKKTRITVSRLQEDIDFVFRVTAMNVVGNSKPLVGAKVKTRLLKIPLSRRSSFRLPSRGDGRDRDYKPSQADAYDRDVRNARAGIEGNTLIQQLDDLDPELEADPFVPKSDFFTYSDETNSGNISNRHGENKTRHSQFSPLPAPPPPSGRVKHAAGLESTTRHSEFSPLPRPKSLRFANGYLTRNSGSTEVESDYDDDIDDGGNHGHDPGIYGSDGDIHGSKHSLDIENKNQISSESTEFPSNINRHDSGMRHSTPYNVAFAHSRY